MHANTHIYKHTCMRTCIHEYIHTHMSTYKYTHIHKYIQIYIFTYMHIHIRHTYIDLFVREGNLASSFQKQESPHPTHAYTHTHAYTNQTYKQTDVLLLS